MKELTAEAANSQTSSPLKLHPTLAILLGSVMISFSAVYVKLTTTPPTTDGFYRMFFGGITLLILSYVRKERQYTSPAALGVAAMCAFWFAVDLVFWHQGIEHIGPGLATIIINLQVFVLAGLGIFLFAEKVNWKFFVAIPLAIIGLYCLVGTEWHAHGDTFRLGLLQAFIGMLCYTAYLLVLRKAQRLPKPLAVLPFMAQMSLMCAAMLALIMLLQGQSFHLGGLQNTSWLILYGVFAQAFGWLLIAYGIPSTPLAILGFLLLSQPALSFTWDILIFHRPTPPIEFAGALITLLAIYLSTTSKKKKIKLK